MNQLEDREYLLRQYLELKKTLGRTPTVTEYFRVVGSILHRLNAIFGKPSWRNMLREVGDTPGQRTRGKIEKEHLLNHYLKLKKKLRRQPTYRDYYHATGHGDAVIGRHFGKPPWRSMLAVLNEKPLDRLQLDPSTRQVMLKDYMHLKKKIGRQPTSREYVVQTKHAMHRIIMVFGKPGWGKLVKAAGDDIIVARRPSVSCKHLIDHFYKLKSRLKRIPTYEEYIAHAKHYYQAIVRCFGRPGWKSLVKFAAKEIKTRGTAGRSDRRKLKCGHPGENIFTYL